MSERIEDIATQYKGLYDGQTASRKTILSRVSPYSLELGLLEKNGGVVGQHTLLDDDVMLWMPKERKGSS